MAKALPRMWVPDDFLGMDAMLHGVPASLGFGRRPPENSRYGACKRRKKTKYSGLEADALPAARERKEEEESTAKTFSNTVE